MKKYTIKTLEKPMIQRETVRNATKAKKELLQTGLNNKHSLDVKKENKSQIKEIYLNNMNKNTTSKKEYFINNQFRKIDKKRSVDISEKFQPYNFFKNKHLMLLALGFYFPAVNCSFVLSLFGRIDSTFGDYIKRFNFVILTIIGGFISILGVKYFRTTLFFLITIALETFFGDFRDYLIELSQKDDNFISSLIGEKIKKFLEYTYRNPINMGIIFLIISLVLSFLIVSLIKTFSIIGFVVVSVFLYKEGFHKKTLIYIGFDEENYIFGLAAYVILEVLLYFAFKKGPLIVFAGIFSFIGPIIFMTGIENIFNLDYGFKKAIETWKDNHQIVDAPGHVFQFIIACCICFVFQFMVILKGKY